MKIDTNIITGNKVVVLSETIIVSNTDNTIIKIPLADKQDSFISFEFEFLNDKQKKSRYDATVSGESSFKILLTNFATSGLPVSSSKPVGISIAGFNYELMFAGVGLGTTYIQLTLTMTRVVLDGK